MKGWQVALLCLATAAFAVSGTLLLIQQTDENTPQVDIPRYIADQVIAVAKAYAGEECVGGIFDEPNEATWTTVYLGDGKWKVAKLCSMRRYTSGTTTTVEEWTFYEATGELKPS